MNRKRFTAFCLMLLILLAVTIFCCATIAGATHDCEGDSCDICRLLSAITVTLRTASLLTVILTVVSVSNALRDILFFSVGVFACLNTPVTEKVKLLN